MCWRLPANERLASLLVTLSIMGFCPRGLVKRPSSFYRPRQVRHDGIGVKSLGVSLRGCELPQKKLARLSAKYVHRVLLGADPGDLPVEQIDTPHFVINLKSAKAFGLTIGPAMLARADEIIE